MKTTEQAPEQILLNFAEWFNAKKTYQYITKELINEYLLSIKQKANKKAEQVLEDVARYFGVTVLEIKSKSRKIRYARPRQVVSYILYYELNFEDYEVAEIIRQNRCTIYHSLKTVESQYMKHVNNILKND